MDKKFCGKPVPLTDPIRTTLKQYDPHVENGELWKFTYKVCICLVPEGEGCAEGQLKCTVLDPHVWAHQRP